MSVVIRSEFKSRSYLNEARGLRDRLSAACSVDGAVGQPVSTGERGSEWGPGREEKAGGWGWRGREDRGEQSEREDY